MLRVKQKWAVVVCLCLLAPMASAQVMTVLERTLKQSDIARAKMDADLHDAQKRATGEVGAAPAVPAAQKITEKEAEDVLSLISVYGVGDSLKADFLFRGAVITLEPKGPTKAAGWEVEKLSPTQAIMVKRSGKTVIRRNTIYLAAAQAAAPLAMPALPSPVPVPGQQPVQQESSATTTITTTATTPAQPAPQTPQNTGPVSVTVPIAAKH